MDSISLTKNFFVMTLSNTIVTDKTMLVKYQEYFDTHEIQVIYPK